MNKIPYPISTEKYIICIPIDFENLTVPFALKYNTTFKYRILVNLDINQLQQKLNNVFQSMSPLDFYNFLHNCKSLIEFERSLTLNIEGVTYSTNLNDFFVSLNNTISLIYSKYFYQINKGIKL